MLPAGTHVRGVDDLTDPSVRMKVREPLPLAMANQRLRFFDTKTELAF